MTTTEPSTQDAELKQQHDEALTAIRRDQETLGEVDVMAMAIGAVLYDLEGAARQPTMNTVADLHQTAGDLIDLLDEAGYYLTEPAPDPEPSPANAGQRDKALDVVQNLARVLSLATPEAVLGASDTVSRWLATGRLPTVEADVTPSLEPMAEALTAYRTEWGGMGPEQAEALAAKVEAFLGEHAGPPF